MDLLKDKVAIVTGSSQGIGAEIAKAFARQGAKVVINYRSNQIRATEIVDHITRLGGTAVSVQADIARPAEIAKLFEETKRAFGRLDILVNNVGILEFELLEAITPENLQTQINTNLIGTILVTQKAAALMEREGGNIINISATTSINPIPGTLVFSATKAAIDNVTKILSKELGPKNIRINTIAPGMTETEGSHQKGIAGSEFEKQNIVITPLGRIAQPEDIAKVAVFLASDDAGCVT
jgi:3-oxoacyl-[acyl-carrier protein] reductase